MSAANLIQNNFCFKKGVPMALSFNKLQNSLTNDDELNNMNPQYKLQILVYYSVWIRIIRTTFYKYFF